MVLKDLVTGFGGNIPSQDDTDNIFDELDFNGDRTISILELKWLLEKVFEVYIREKPNNPDISLSSLFGLSH